MRFVLFAVLALIPLEGIAQQPSVDLELSEYSQRLMANVLAEESIVRDTFSGSLNRAARNLAREGKITRRQAIRLRVAMLSPAFRAHAEDLAVVQMYYSGENGELVPLNPDGTVNRAAIDWDGLILFLEKLIPLILQLLEILG